jgi:AbrB family looped-hinge helix DNA binding protein
MLRSVTTTVSSKGQIVLPAKIRQQDRIEAGQEFEIERIDEGEYLLRRKTRRANEGLVKLLLACPVKDWFRPIDRTDTTDDIAAPEFG